MRIRKHLLVGGATAAVALASVAAAVAARRRSGEPSRRTAPARSRPSRRPLPNRMSASTAAPASSSASPARAAASSASARTRPTCPTPRGRSGCPRRRGATTPGSATSSSWWPTTASRSRSTDEHLGELLDDRRAEEDLGPRLEREQLERRSAGIPERPAAALRPRHGLGHVRVLHREDQRSRTAEPVGLLGLRGRQRPGAGCRGRARRARLLRALVLPREQEPPEGSPGELRQRLRHSERRERPERTYKPLSRGLFVYAKKKAFKRDVVAGFIRHMIVNERAISRTAKIVPLTKRSSARRSGSTTPRSGTGRTTRRA